MNSVSLQCQTIVQGQCFMECRTGRWESGDSLLVPRFCEEYGTGVGHKYGENPPPDLEVRDLHGTHRPSRMSISLLPSGTAELHRPRTTVSCG